MSKGVLAGVAVLVIGLLLLGVVLFFFRPQQQTVYIALEDLPAGSRITPDKVTRVNVSMRNVDLYLNPRNVAQYGYGVLTQPVKKGQFIPLTLIVAKNSKEAQDFRVSLGLDDPNMVAFNIPVKPDDVPRNITAGDVVDLSIAIGSASFLSGKLETVPTPVIYNPYRAEVNMGVVPEMSAGTPSPTPLPSPTATPTPQNFTLPVGKVTVYNLRVLEVQYEERANPAYTTNTDTGGLAISPFIRGDIRSVTVAVPRDQVEALTFALASASQFHIVVHSPLYTPEPGQEAVYAGVSWDDFVAYFKFMREMWAMGKTTSPYPIAGMSSLYPTLEATLHPPTPIPATPTPLPATPTPTPTPTSAP